MENFEINRYDSFYGIVVQETRRGVIIETETGLRGFSFSSLKLNNKVLCSIKKIENDKIRFSVDSVIYAA